MRVRSMECRQEWVIIMIDQSQEVKIKSNVTNMAR